MEKKEIISIIKDVRISQDSWLNQGRIILEGINLDRIEAPVEHTDTEFGQWCITNQDKMYSFLKFNDLQELHESFHQTYSNLFYDSIRKYNPSTIDQLQERFESLKSDSNDFHAKLDEIEAELYNISDESLSDLVTKSISDFNDLTTAESLDQVDVSVSDKEESDVSTDEDCSEGQDVENNQDLAVEQTVQSDKEPDPISSEIANQSDDEGLQVVDINNLDNHQNPFDELETVMPMKDLPQNNLAKVILQDEPVENSILKTINKKSKSKSGNEALISSAVPSSKRLISLKEQNIVQLNQEKELTKLELVHIENTQNHTQQSIEQLEQYYTLKQEEIKLEQSNTVEFLDFKSNAKVKIEAELVDIEAKKDSLLNDIKELEEQTIKEVLELNDRDKDDSIDKQFEELKQNKNKTLTELKDSKKEKESEIIKLTEQLLLLEDEVVVMEEDIDIKQKDLLDLEEKESLRNEDRSKQQLEREKGQQERDKTILNLEEELDLLTDDEQIKLNELSTFEFQIEELNKNNLSVEEAYSDELKNLETQQEHKHKKLLEIEKSKASKQTEITDIDLRIIAVERSLEKLKLDQSEEETEQASEELVEAD